MLGPLSYLFGVDVTAIRVWAHQSLILLQEKFSKIKFTKSNLGLFRIRAQAVIYYPQIFGNAFLFLGVNPIKSSISFKSQNLCNLNFMLSKEHS